MVKLSTNAGQLAASKSERLFALSWLRAHTIARLDRMRMTISAQNSRLRMVRQLFAPGDRGRYPSHSRSCVDRVFEAIECLLERSRSGVINSVSDLSGRITSHAPWSTVRRFIVCARSCWSAVSFPAASLFDRDAINCLMDHHFTDAVLSV